ADTPTDPAPLEMVETFVNFRPRELWPRRALAYDDAARQARLVLAALEERGYLRRARAHDRHAPGHDAATNAPAGFDEAMGEVALPRYRERETERGPVLPRFAVEDAVRRFRAARLLRWPEGADEQAEVERLVGELAPKHGIWLSKSPALEDVARVT